MPTPGPAPSHQTKLEHQFTLAGLQDGCARALGLATARPRARRERKALRRDTDRLVDSMPLPDPPYGIQELTANIEAARGRRIIMKPLPDQLAHITGFCGLWIKHDTRPLDLVLHTQGGSPKHEFQIKLHELAHVWADDVTGVVGTDEMLRDLTPERVESMVAAGKIAGRRRYTTAVERRAEDAAALISERARRPRLSDDAVARRLAEDFSYPTRQ